MKEIINLRIAGRNFDIDVEDKFSEFLRQQIEKDFSASGNNDVKILVKAYIRKNHEFYKQMKKIEELLQKLDK